jgi:hypothetical protein
MQQYEHSEFTRQIIGRRLRFIVIWDQDCWNLLTNLAWFMN